MKHPFLAEIFFWVVLIALSALGVVACAFLFGCRGENFTRTTYISYDNEYQQSEEIVGTRWRIWEATDPGGKIILDVEAGAGAHWDELNNFEPMVAAGAYLRWRNVSAVGTLSILDPQASDRSVTGFFSLEVVK